MMNYEEKVKLLKKVKITKSLREAVSDCVYEYNRYNNEEDNDTINLRNKLSNEKPLNAIDIDLMMWLLKRYQYTEEIENIFENNLEKIETEYE